MACKIGIIIYSILQFAAFVLILVGTPIDMFRSKNDDVFGNTYCVTMWGLKEKCYSIHYDTKIGTLFQDCPGRADRFRAAEAFAIINIGLYGIACIFGFILLCCCVCFRWICLVLNILGISAVVTWVIMVDALMRAKGTGVGYCDKLSDDYKYGAGFALVIVAWGLDIVNIIFLMLPC